MFLWLGAVVVLLYIVFKIKTRRQTWSIPRGPFADKLNDATAPKRQHYDVAIVGAGPAGASCAYFLKKQGVHVLLLEKKKFPRDKYCGDAVCKTGIELLMEMGIYEQLIKENKAHIADAGGLVSPSGLSYIGRSHQELGSIPAAMAVKRIHLDEAIALNARKHGADLRENMNVVAAKFDEKVNLWTVECENTSQETGSDADDVTISTSSSSSSSSKEEKKQQNLVTYQARLLVCADGAASKLAIQLGIVNEPPRGVCSRAFVEGGTHQFDADGVVFYNKNLLPGYSALFRHPQDELNFCCYLIPGNPKVTDDTLKYWHDFLIQKDPFVAKALGPNAKIERMKAASLRLGGINCSYGKHLLVIGDAAGLIDPMTGEGIHHAMDSGRIAATTLVEAIKAGNYSADALKVYHYRWKQEFGDDFYWSMKICLLLYRFPILLDAATAAIQRKGNKFLARWAEIMTGRTPKFHLLHPEFVLVITFELFRLILLRTLGSKSK